MKTVSAEIMRKLDKKTIEEANIPGKTLMYRAGCGAAEEIANFAEKLNEKHRKRFIFLAGKGNNGGDAYVAAEHLRKIQKYQSEIHIFSICSKNELKGDAAHYSGKISDEIHFKAFENNEIPKFQKGDILIDAVLGTGITGAPREPAASWIDTVNKSNLPVIALDNPSGLNCSTGKCAGSVTEADMTLCIGMPKSGMFLSEGINKCGLIRLIDIGIPEKFIAQSSYDFESIWPAEISEIFHRIPTDSHKGTRGRVLIAGGSEKYRGAPLLSAKAALRSGAGMVICAFPESSGLHPASPASLISIPLKDKKGYFYADSADKNFCELCGKSDTVLVGPGIGQEKCSSAFLEKILQFDKNLVIDADALNLISKKPSLLTNSTASKIVLTPHPGEMERLLKGFNLKKLLKSERIKQSRALAEKTGAYIILKGSRTVITTPQGRSYVNRSGCPALSVGGSGDVLAGIIAAYASQDFAFLEALSAAVYIHGLASEISKKGYRGTLPEDIINLIPQAVKEITPFL